MSFKYCSIICLLIFVSENSDLHGLIPGSNKFTSKFLQNCVCPLSLSEFITKGKTASSSGLSSLCVLFIFSFNDCY